MNTVLETPGTPQRLRTIEFIRKIPYGALFAGLTLMLALTVPSIMSAQGITGSITGTVSDPSGAVIAGATVTVKQLETNAMKTITTSDAGTYTITQLQPGHYSVTVEKAGFKSNTQSGITLAIDQVAMINSQLDGRVATGSC